MSLKFEMRLSGMDGVLKLLKSLPPEIVSKRGGPVKSALRKGAQVIRKQALSNLQASIDRTASDDERQSTGLLMKNVVVTRGKPPHGGNGERYLVRVRRKAYPDRKGRPVTTLATANLKEYGSEKMAADPWIRPAASDRAGEAIHVATSELTRQLDRIVKRLAQQSGSR